jgi:phosphohistidine phosphatase SixA
MPYPVRHAHADDKRAWTGPDRLRPLSGSGRREAHGLLVQLRPYPVVRILSSPAVRCVQTVEPLAQRRGLPVERAEVLGVDADPEALLALLVDPAAAEAVLCSHGELIRTVLERLGGRGLDTAGQLAWPKVLAGCWRWAAGGSSISRYLRRSAPKTPRPATTRGCSAATSSRQPAGSGTQPTPGTPGCARHDEDRGCSTSR